MDELIAGVSAGSEAAPQAVATDSTGRKRLAAEVPQKQQTSAVFQALVKLSLASAALQDLGSDVLPGLRNSNDGSGHDRYEGGKYSEVQKQMKASGKSQEVIKQELGLPCVHAFVALATVVAEKSTVKDKLLIAIKGWKSKAEAQGLRIWMYVHKYVRLCRIEKQYEGAKKKLCIQIQGESRESLPVEDATPCEVWALYIYPMFQSSVDIKEMCGVALDSGK